MTDVSFVVSPQARADLDANILWLRAEADVATAIRFADAADPTMPKVAAAPSIGSPVVSSRPALAALRKIGIAGFRNSPIFYVRTDGVIRIVRVLHAAQDWLTHLEDG